MILHIAQFPMRCMHITWFIFSINFLDYAIRHSFFPWMQMFFSKRGVAYVQIYFLKKTFLQCFIPLSQLHFCLWMQLFLFVNFGASYYSRSIAKDCLFTVQEQACCRITWLFGCQHAENGPILRKMAIDCPLVITSIVETLFQTRQDHERGIICQASLLHSWHWVLFLL